MTGISLATRVKLSDDVLFQELQGEAVLLDLKTGVYFGLDSVGTRIWQLLGEKETLSDVAASICQEFDVTPDLCAQDLVALVDRLREQALLTVSQ